MGTAFRSARERPAQRPLDSGRYHRQVEEVLRVALHQHGKVSEAWIAPTVEPSLRREREERPEELTDPVGRAELGDEARAFSFDLKRVRLPDRDGDRLAWPHELRAAKALPDLDGALPDEEAFLLAQMAMQGPSITAIASLDLRAQRCGLESSTTARRCNAGFSSSSPGEISGAWTGEPRPTGGAYDRPFQWQPSVLRRVVECRFGREAAICFAWKGAVCERALAFRP